MLKPELTDILQLRFRLNEFRHGQQEIITAILDKKDVLAVLPTGGGKSLCYQLPTLAADKLTIVVSPLIALMKDQVQSMQKLGIPSGCLYSGQSQDEKRVIFQQIKKGGAYLLYLSPERVQKEGFKNWILNQDLGLFAIDEAHCVSQWGHDFRQEYAQLKLLKHLRADVPMLALTASATPRVLSDISSLLMLKNPERHVHGFYRPNLFYQVQTCESDEEKQMYILQGLSQTPKGRILIYCGTRKVTESLAQFLKSSFAQVGFYHAGLATEERNRIQDLFAQGELRILVATNAFGMGIDQPDVRLVIHYQMPANIDALYQEMGRAGRDGEASTCLLLYSKKDYGLQSYFIKTSEARGEVKDQRFRNLDLLLAYAEGGECRHADILTYYRDAQRIKVCGHCDLCLTQSVMRIQRPHPNLWTALESKATGQIQKRQNSKKAKRQVDWVELGTEAQDRFELLKIWRRGKAQELDVPAFVVFSDKTLGLIATQNPQSMQDLRLVHGVGDSKLERFGSEILSLL